MIHPSSTHMRYHTLPLVLPTVLLGLSLSSCAMAQQEGGRAPAATASGPTTHTFGYQSTDDEGRSIELRIENGRVVTAKVDGRSIPAARVKKVADGYDLLAEDGSLIKHVAVVQPGSRQESREALGNEESGPRRGSSASSSSGSSSSSSGGRTRSESRAAGDVRGNGRAEAGTSGGASGEQDGRRSEARSRARIAIAPDARGVEIREGMPLMVRDVEIAMGEAPKSMIGAGLGSPDGALVHHLKIDAAKSTMVTGIVEGLPAQAAGLEQYDIIVSVNGDRNASAENLRRVLRDAEPGAKIALEVLRGAETRKVEVTAVAFDGDKLVTIEGSDVQGFAVPPMDSFGGDGGEGGVMFFVGPDGRRRELRMPAMPAMPNGFEPDQMEGFQRAMEGFDRRMEEWSRQMEQRMREQGFDGDVDVDVQGAPGAPRNRNPRMREGVELPRGADDRMRRLEERLDQLMRELERDRAERRDAKGDA